VNISGNNVTTATCILPAPVPASGLAHVSCSALNSN